MHDEGRHVRHAQDALGGASQKRTLQPAFTLGADDDRVDQAVLREIDDGVRRAPFKHMCRGSYARPHRSRRCVFQQRLCHLIVFFYNEGDGRRIQASRARHRRNSCRVIDRCHDKEFAAVLTAQCYGQR